MTTRAEQKGPPRQRGPARFQHPQAPPRAQSPRLLGGKPGRGSLKDLSKVLIINNPPTSDLPLAERLKRFADSPKKQPKIPPPVRRARAGARHQVHPRDSLLRSVSVRGGYGGPIRYQRQKYRAPKPGFFNLDASVFRDFYIREEWKLQFRTEAYGLTNSPVFANPGATASNATFSNGTITTYNGHDIIGSATGDQQIRFALKLLF